MKLDLLKIAIKASIEAGLEILKIYNKDYSVNYKEDSSPLTEADTASNNIIISYLENTKIPIISEENKQLPFAVRKKWSQCWIVDPLDGTKEFIKKNDEFSVNIAFIKNGIPKFGVIYSPATGELYYTNASKLKAFKIVINNLKNFEQKLFKDEDLIKPSNPSKRVIKVIASRSHMNDETMRFVKDLNSTYRKVEIVSKGSSLKFCLIAEGKAEIYPRFAPTMVWDTAAGQAICEAVGYRVIDRETKENVVYNRKSLLNNNFLVTREFKS
jgi:3'(2'), 5'-bisphosphate nucleotidase